MLRCQPPWLLALAQRLDDSDAVVRTAAARAFSALLVAVAVGDLDEAFGASGRPRTAVFLVSLMLRQQSDAAEEMREAVEAFVKLAEEHFSEELFSCLGLVDPHAVQTDRE